MMNKPTGGPAFPINVDSEMTCLGITARDYFAAKAMDVAMNQIKDYYGIDKDAVAKWCYAMADAMLKAREQ
jgi:hypothetical protein